MAPKTIICFPFNFFCVKFSNDVAISFYTANGFEQGEMISDYYKKIDPPHCFVLSKRLDCQREEEGEGRA